MWNEVLNATCREARRGVVLAEGLLIYLGADEVTALGRDLAAAGFQCWIVDLASPALLTLMTQEMGDLVARAGAPYSFAPQDGPDFFRPSGWTARDGRSTFRSGAIAAAAERSAGLRWVPGSAGAVEAADTVVSRGASRS